MYNMSFKSEYKCLKYTPLNIADVKYFKMLLNQLSITLSLLS